MRKLLFGVVEDKLRFVKTSLARDTVLNDCKFAIRLEAMHRFGNGLREAHIKSSITRVSRLRMRFQYGNVVLPSFGYKKGGVLVGLLGYCRSAHHQMRIGIAGEIRGETWC